MDIYRIDMRIAPAIWVEAGGKVKAALQPKLIESPPFVKSPALLYLIIIFSLAHGTHRVKFVTLLR